MFLQVALNAPVLLLTLKKALPQEETETSECWVTLSHEPLPWNWVTSTSAILSCPHARAHTHTHQKSDPLLPFSYSRRHLIRPPVTIPIFPEAFEQRILWVHDLPSIFRGGSPSQRSEVFELYVMHWKQTSKHPLEQTVKQINKHKHN